jgi:hypothetical protein
MGRHEANAYPICDYRSGMRKVTLRDFDIPSNTLFNNAVGAHVALRPIKG